MWGRRLQTGLTIHDKDHVRRVSCQPCPFWILTTQCNWRINQLFEIRKFSLGKYFLKAYSLHILKVKSRVFLTRDKFIYLLKGLNFEYSQVLVIIMQNHKFQWEHLSGAWQSVQWYSFCCTGVCPHPTCDPSTGWVLASLKYFITCLRTKLSKRNVPFMLRV